MRTGLQTSHPKPQPLLFPSTIHHLSQKLLFGQTKTTQVSQMQFLKELTKIIRGPLPAQTNKRMNTAVPFRSFSPFTPIQHNYFSHHSPSFFSVETCFQDFQNVDISWKGKLQDNDMNNERRVIDLGGARLRARKKSQRECWKRGNGVSLPQQYTCRKEGIETKNPSIASKNITLKPYK
jgi:hypothetical protein